MTYYNPVFRMGLERFFSVAKECMVDGVIVPDLPVEEADDYIKAANQLASTQYSSQRPPLQTSVLQK